MRGLIMALVLTAAAPAWAENWQVLDQDGGVAALTDRALIYEGGETQDFRPSGRTLYNAGANSWGYWEIRDGRYCSQWPPSDAWDCYELSISQDGQSIRFLDDWDNEFIGTYTD